MHPSSSSQSAKFKVKSSLQPHLLRKIAAKKTTNIIVVGGGLTSAQIVEVAISAGVSKVWHIMRGRMKVKHFDVTLGGEI
jgi:NADPH-dependent glutamate synthase beta subunit-like oxidoreductase